MRMNCIQDAAHFCNLQLVSVWYYAPINVKPHSPPLGQGMGQGGD